MLSMNGVQVAAVVVALTVALMAGLSVWRTKSAGLGFDASGVLLYTVAPRGASAEGQSDFARFAEATVARVTAVRGVRSAGVATATPVAGGGESTLRLKVPGGHTTSIVVAGWRAASPTFFETLGVAWIGGRVFSEESGDSAVEVVANRALASALWQSRSAIGQEAEVVGAFARRILRADRVRIVGEIGNTVRRGLSQARPEVYVPLRASPLLAGTLLVRWSGSPHATKDIEEALSAVDPTRPLERDEPVQFERLVNEILALPRILAGSMSALSGAIGVLALYGIWSVTTLTAIRRLKEGGIRQALGAQRRHLIAALASTHALALGGGLLGGMIGMRMLGPYVADRFSLSPGYGWAVQVLAVAMVAVAAGAALAWPIRDATRRSPAEMLREP